MRTIGCWLLAAWGALAAAQPAAGAAPERPNVVLLMTDDQGYGDVGLHGNPAIRTPRLDRFAREGVELERFYCSPVCAPTRASLMTGRYYYRTGVIHTSRGGAKMWGDETTIAELLGAAGYATGVFGKWHLGDNYPMRPQDQGFQESLVHKSGGIGQTPDRPNSYFDPWLWRNGRRVRARGYCTDVFFRAAIDFIERRRGQPLFVYLATNAPHAPLEVDSRYVAPYLAQGLDETTARVYAMVTNIDDNLGRLLQALERLGLRDNTLFLFLTDNGPQQARYNAGLRGRKSWVYEGGIRVPCFVQWPRRVAGGRTVRRIAAHIDVLPTVLEACGVQQPRSLELDGRSFLPALLDPAQAEPDPQRMLMFQCHRGLTPHRYQNCAVVTQRYKAVAGAGEFSREDDQSPDPPAFELYDLQSDPGEQHDLAAQRPELVRRLQTAYDRWLDDVRRSRNFTPGLIEIGSDAENPSHLCRYQDATYREGRPHGWSVRILRGGAYRVRINRGPVAGPAVLHVRWLGRERQAPLAAGQDAAEFALEAGQGVLDIWVQRPGEPRVVIADNSTAGDVDLERL